MTELERSHQGSYDRGVEQGKVLERLEGHDNHFRRINGSIDKSTDRLASLENTMDRMVNLITSATSFTTAQSAKEVDKEISDGNKVRIPGMVFMGSVVIILLIILILLEIR